MPGTEDGSSKENARTWSHTQYPGGTRVFGGAGNTEDWWALDLLASTTYVFQTRLPTPPASPWDTTLTLHDAAGTQLAFDDDGGDDGNFLSKITHTTPAGGALRHYLVVRAFGGGPIPSAYTLESIPAPILTFRARVVSRLSSLLAPIHARVISRFDAVAFRLQARSISRHDALVLKGWSVYARDTGTGNVTFLGFIPGDADPKELADVPLAAGVYEIEVRSSEWFWQEARGRRLATLITNPVGGGGPISGLPVIRNLRREIVSFQSRIRWEVAAEQAAQAFKFGLWFGPASPVDTSGPPDETVSYVQGQGAYEATHAQSVSEYVAVAAFTPTQKGEVAGLFMPWDSVAPPTPAGQHADPAGP